MLNRFIKNAIYRIRIFLYGIKKRAPNFPSTFCIQTINICNGACIMCPFSQKDRNKPSVMSDELFEKIITEISQKKLKFTYIYLFLQNEPLMDRNIFNKIRFIKQISNGKIKTGLVTNGSLLTNEIIEELIESKIDEIIFSLDALTEETYSKIRQGLNFKKVLKNIEKIINSKYNKYIAVKFIIQKDNISELNGFISFWNKKNIPIQVSYINNRSGDLNNFNRIRLKNNNKLDISRFKGYIIKYLTGRMVLKGCSTPIITFNILYNGDVILCCDDFNNKMILGNLKISSIENIWNNKKYKEIRDLLYNGNFNKIPVCSLCSKINTS
jgi:radical SAM protein with 4Fe4S-binding SPASM domain